MKTFGAVSLEARSTDPAVTANGDLWFRSDRRELRQKMGSDIVVVNAEATWPMVFTGADKWTLTTPGGIMAVTPVPVINQLMATPIVVPRAVTLTKVCCIVSTAGGSAAVIRAGLASGLSTGYPDTVLDDFGTVSATTTGAKVWTPGSPPTLKPSTLYFILGVWQVGTVPTIRTAQGQDALVQQDGVTPPTNNNQNAYTKTGVSGALSGSFGTPADALQGPRWYLQFGEPA